MVEADHKVIGLPRCFIQQGKRTGRKAIVGIHKANPFTRDVCDTRSSGTSNASVLLM